MTSDADRYLLDLFRQSGDWSDVDIDTMGYVFSRHAQPGEDLTRMLIRVKVFQRTGVQVLDMMRAGQLKPPHLSFLFAAAGTKQLKHSLTVEAERRVAREAREARGEAPAAAKLNPFAMPGSSPRLAPLATHSSSSVRLATLPSSATVSLSGSAAAIDPTPRVGSVLGKCLLTGLLGQGGNGKVFSGLHQTLNIQVAIKVLSTEDADLTHEQIARLAREAQLLARLNHPNVIRVLDYDDAPIPYVTMEFVEGLSLADLIDQTGGLRVPRTADMMIQVANGLAAAWDVGLVHRDIKPGNILLTKSGMAKVTDLGLAIRFGSDTSPPHSQSGPPSATISPQGTCGYISPEQAVNDPTIDFRADIYSLGATFYHAVTGRLPFMSKSTRQLLMMHMSQPLTPPHEVAPGVVNEAASAVICRMMEKNPNDRYGSYDELIADLIPLAEGGPRASTVMNTPPHGSSTPTQYRHRTYR
jgi:hypothetical protein